MITGRCLLTFAVTVLVGSVADAKNLNLTFSKKENIGPGTVFYSGKCSDPKWHVFVAETDLKNPHVEVVPATPPPDKGVRTTPSVIAEALNATVVVNSGFFSMNNGIPYGYFRANGKTARSSTGTFGALGFSWGPFQTPYVGNINEKEQSVTKGNTEWPLEKLESACAGGPVLLVNGQIQISEEYPELAKRNPRTALGFDKKTSKLYLAVIDGRSSDSVGMTFEETARLMQDLGCTDALNFDGGGSSAMVINGKVKNKPSGKAQRPVPLCWAVLNSTIVDDSVASPRFTATGNWQNDKDTTSGLYRNTGLFASGGQEASAVFDTPLPQTGYYDVYARWNNGTRPGADNAHYTVEAAGQTATVIKDQTKDPGQWNKLGTYQFRNTSRARVVLTTKGVSKDKTVSADAVRFVFAGTDAEIPQKKSTK